ncbi:hypothetical protein QWJ26_01200 [Streptomyces sp. CSDS2]|uniref:hypothetical protein n=1 Tax=Streptomyces sp. CSDS2 TaxID=3055051 RepID=UPI0025AF4043|nr:hypothetical protein [Streptomyces sp. CSDS2]MDN3258449.1 hypothetical protein [Streptomyces sp. CSDS2]
MSTPVTGADGPRPRRLRLPFPARPAPGTARRAPDRAGRASRPPLVLAAGDQGTLLEDAGRHGRQAGKKKTLDPWLLHGDEPLPYFVKLAGLRDAMVHRIEEELHERQEEARLQDARAAAGITTGQARTLLLDRRLQEADKAVQAALDQLDLLALRSSRWLRFRDRLRERVEERWLRARFGDAAGPAPAATAPGDDGTGPAPGKEEGADPGDDWQSVSTAATAPDGTAPTALGEDYRAALRETGLQGSADRWEGLLTRPGLPRWLTLALLAAIMAVEVPVYWVAYQPFHGVGSTGGDVLSGTLAVSSAVVMLIVPHLAGHMLRWRSATGAPRSGWLPSLTLLGVWGALTWLLGTLRARFVTQHDTPAEGDDAGFRGLGGPGADATSLVDRLHLSTQTVTWLFCALLLLSGGVGFLLGLFREHPFLDAFRTAVERREDLQRQHDESVAATERARAERETAQARQEDRREAARERIAATRELYESAAAEFLQGLVTASKDPAVSEAAMRRSDRRPLLPGPRPLG